VAFKTWWGHQYMLYAEHTLSPPGYYRVEMEAKTWWGPITMPTGAPVKSRFKKEFNLQIHYNVETSVFFYTNNVFLLNICQCLSNN
jgi:hypothetical protein